MGRHATIGNSNVGHKNQTGKQGAKLAATKRIYLAAMLSGPVTVEKTAIITDERPIPQAQSMIASRIKIDVEPFHGLNLIHGDEFIMTGTNTYTLWVKEGMVRLEKHNLKDSAGKSFPVWFGIYGKAVLPLLANNGQALGFAASKGKLLSLLTTAAKVKRVKITPADKAVKAPKAYYGGGVAQAFCDTHMEPKRACGCH